MPHSRSKKSVAESALEQIEKHLAKNACRMTPVRREIIAHMVELGEPRTAYQILAAVNKKRKVKLSPISLYRTLGFLMRAGVALKLESKNAFRLCLHPKSGHSHIMVVCDTCGAVQEIYDQALTKAIVRAAKKHGHVMKHSLIELHGTCRDC